MARRTPRDSPSPALQALLNERLRTTPPDRLSSEELAYYYSLHPEHIPIGLWIKTEVKDDDGKKYKRSNKVSGYPGKRYKNWSEWQVDHFKINHRVSGRDFLGRLMPQPERLQYQLECYRRLYATYQERQIGNWKLVLRAIEQLAQEAKLDARKEGYAQTNETDSS